ncbi:MAG: hypothetical protein J6Y19_00315, partial [Kiritimatiellae bacterium]|nr:hypothetical protein [Kiritimatiellia bacterium]
LADKAQIRQYADTLRTLLDLAIDPVPDDTGAIVVPEGRILLSGDLPRTDPPTVLLDGGTLLFAPYAAHIRQLLDQTDHYLANAPDGAPPPSFLPVNFTDHFSAPVLVGPSGGRLDLVDGARAVTVASSIRPADGLPSATLTVSGGPDLILDRASLSPAIDLRGDATLADLLPSGPIRNRAPFSSP